MLDLARPALEARTPTSHYDTADCKPCAPPLAAPGGTLLVMLHVLCPRARPSRRMSAGPSAAASWDDTPATASRSPRQRPLPPQAALQGPALAAGGGALLSHRVCGNLLGRLASGATDLGPRGGLRCAFLIASGLGACACARRLACRRTCGCCRARAREPAGPRHTRRPADSPADAAVTQVQCMYRGRSAGEGVAGVACS